MRHFNLILMHKILKLLFDYYYHYFHCYYYYHYYYYYYHYSVFKFDFYINFNNYKKPRDLQSQSRYSVQIMQNTTRKNSEFRQFSLSVGNRKSFELQSTIWSITNDVSSNWESNLFGSIDLQEQNIYNVGMCINRFDVATSRKQLKNNNLIVYKTDVDI